MLLNEIDSIELTQAQGIGEDKIKCKIKGDK